jgi:hypothetical protein
MPVSIKLGNNTSYELASSSYIRLDILGIRSAQACFHRRFFRREPAKRVEIMSRAAEYLVLAPKVESDEEEMVYGVASPK